ncbi:MAG: hypothetical protein ACRDPL_11165 [Propionibacteriaceae bacterium]
MRQRSGPVAGAVWRGEQQCWRGQHAEDSHQWLTDIFRREELDQMRWRLVIVTSDGIYRDPLRTLVRVRDALLECGATGIRRTFKPEWKLHFQVH